MHFELDFIIDLHQLILCLPANLALILSQIPVNVLHRGSKLIDLFHFCLVGGVQRGLPSGQQIIVFFKRLEGRHFVIAHILYLAIDGFKQG